jgi:hypothetical protein
MAEGEILDNLNEKEKAKIAPLTATNWLAEIKAAEKNLDKWHDQARRIVKRFLDRRDDAQESQNKLNLFTTNTNILIATLYARFPKPLVTREFEDQDDDVARVAATMMERMLKIQPRDDVDSAMRSIVQDRLVPGMGQVWLRYDPVITKGKTEDVLDPETGEMILKGEEFERVVDEKVAVDYVFWEDFIFSPARTWERVRWVGRRIKMNKADAEERFGRVIAGQLKFTKGSGPTSEPSQTGSEGPENDDVHYACVYEIWCKRSRKVYWVSPGVDIQLDQKDDMLGIKGFWPCPKPITALTSTSNFVPRPDFLMAQDQYEELDSVNNRITLIERAIKVVGVYDGANDEIKRIFDEGIDNKIIGVRSFREFMERGGMKGAIDWLPIEAMVNALEKLRSYRQDLIAQIYEVTGISDIMRGSTKASETLGAQQLKAQYGSVRLQFLQMEVAAFLEEVLDIKAEIIRNHFQPETILRFSNIQLTPDAKYAQEAMQLIKSPMFDIRAQVHADSMAVPEFNAERDGRMGFIRAISEMMTAAAPILEKSPQAGIAMLKVIQWGAASFRSGNTIESVLDEAIKAIENTVKQPKTPPPPTPQEIATTKKDESQSVLNLAKAQEATANAIVNLTTEDKPETPPPMR